MTTEPRYTYTLMDFLTNEPLLEVPMSGVQVDRKLSDVGYFQGIINLDSTGFSNADIIDASIPGRTVMCMRRYGTPIWAGPITSRSYSSQAKQLTLSAASFEYMLERRIIRSNVSYTNTDQFTMFYGLWSLMQSGPGCNYGVSAPAILPTSGVLKTLIITDSEFKKFRAAVDEIVVADDGFDWTIDLGDQDDILVKTLRTGYPIIGVPNTEIVFEYPGSVINYYYTERTANAGTHFYLQGDGAGDTTLIGTAVQQDLIDSSFPRYDDDDQLKQMTSQVLVNARAQAEGAKRRIPVGAATVFLKGDADPEFGSWGLGDNVRLVLMDPRFPDALQLPNARPTAWQLTPASSDSPELVSITFDGDDNAS